MNLQRKRGDRNEDKLAARGHTRPLDFKLGSNHTMFLIELSGVPHDEDVNLHDHPDDPPVEAIASDRDLDFFFNQTPGIELLADGISSVADVEAGWWEFTAHTTEGDYSGKMG